MYDRSSFPSILAPATPRPLGSRNRLTSESVYSHRRIAALTLRSGPQFSPCVASFAGLSGSESGPTHASSRNGALSTSVRSAALSVPNRARARLASTSACCSGLSGTAPRAGKTGGSTSATTIPASANGVQRSCPLRLFVPRISSQSGRREAGFGQDLEGTVCVDRAHRLVESVRGSLLPAMRHRPQDVVEDEIADPVAQRPP